METIELLELLAKGEDSTRQFKKDVTNADEIPVPGATVADLDYFRDYFQERFGETLDKQKLPLQKILDNMKRNLLPML